MQPDYVRIDVKTDDKQERLKRILPEVISYPLFYQPSKMQISMCQMGDFQGLQILLPITMKELADVKTDWMKAYVTYIEKHLKISQTAFFVADPLIQRFSMDNESYEMELKLMLLRDTTDYLMRKHKIARQMASVMLIDDNTWHTVYAMQQLSPGCNHMILVTGRGQELTHELDDIFQEYGLFVQVIRPDDVGEFTCDIVINLCQEREKITSHISGYGILMDFGYSDKKAIRLSQINPKLSVYHTIKLKSMHDTIFPKELSQILYYKEPLFQKFAAGILKKDAYKDLINLWDRYFVEMVRVF